jgi:hypothetical protein
MQLTVTTDDDRIVTLDVGESETVENLKAILEVGRPFKRPLLVPGR